MTEVDVAVGQQAWAVSENRRSHHCILCDGPLGTVRIGEDTMRHRRRTVLVGIAMSALFVASTPLAYGSSRENSGCPGYSQVPGLYCLDAHLQGWVGGQQQRYGFTGVLPDEFSAKSHRNRLIDHPPPGIPEQVPGICRSDGPLVPARKAPSFPKYSHLRNLEAMRTGRELLGLDASYKVRERTEAAVDISVKNERKGGDKL